MNNYILDAKVDGKTYDMHSTQTRTYIYYIGDIVIDLDYFIPLDLYSNIPTNIVKRLLSLKAFS